MGGGDGYEGVGDGVGEEKLVVVDCGWGCWGN